MHNILCLQLIDHTLAGSGVESQHSTVINNEQCIYCMLLLHNGIHPPWIAYSHNCQNIQIT